MTWPTYLDHLEAVLEHAEDAFARGDLDRAAAVVDRLVGHGADEDLPALTLADADRARAAAGRLAALEARTAGALQRRRPELTLLAAAQPPARGALYLDHRS